MGIKVEKFLIPNSFFFPGEPTLATNLVDALIKAIQLIISLDPETIQITFLSLQISLFAVFYACLLGIPFGIVIGSKEFFGKRLILTIVNTGMSFPPVVMGLLIFVLFTPIGPIGSLGFNILLTPQAMILAQFLLAFPIIAGLVSSAVTNIDFTVREAAYTLGANSRQMIWMQIREIRTDILASIITAFGEAISEIGAVLIVGGNIRYKTRTLTTAIGRDIDGGLWAEALALGIILLTTAFLINLILTFIQHRDVKIIKGD